MKKIILGIFIVTLFAGCSALQPQSSTLTLDGPEWKLVAINHKVISNNDFAYLKFDGKDLEVKGKVFCNSITARLRAYGR